MGICSTHLYLVNTGWEKLLRWCENVCRTDHVAYDVDVQASVWVQHANQLDLSLLVETKLPDIVIPLGVLLDTMDLPQISKSQSHVETKV